MTNKLNAPLIQLLNEGIDSGDIDPDAVGTIEGYTGEEVELALHAIDAMNLLYDISELHGFITTQEILDLVAFTFPNE